MNNTQLFHYRIHEKLGQGGMGEVYSATDTKLSREVAVKILPESVANPEIKRRFLQEAQISARLNHPAITQVYDLEEHQGKWFIVMERIHGKTIRELVAKRELDLIAALDVAIQTAEGLAKAHEAGIAHRDIKSTNVMLTDDGRVKILDFGLAKLLEAPVQTTLATAKTALLEDEAMTQCGTILGTLGYMSPEQAKGGDIDFRTDLFSLGVMLFEMVTGQLPFARSTRADTYHAIAFEEPPSLRSIRPNVPIDLQQVVSKCLRKRPADRYANAAFLVHDLRAVRSNIETGRTSRFSISKWLGEEWELLRNAKGGEYILYGIGFAVLAMTLYLMRVQLNLASAIITVMILLTVFRYIRHQRLRLLEKYVRSITRIPEILLIRMHPPEITVVVEQSSSRLYERLHSRLDRSNRKLFFGEPIKLRILNNDTNAREEVQSILHHSGVRYVRQDVLDSIHSQEFGATENLRQTPAPEHIV